MREIVDGILTWSWFSEPHGYDFNGHLIRDPGGNICVDPVEPAEGDLEAIVGEGVTRILLTNRNHSRAANRIRARTGAQTAIHADIRFAWMKKSNGARHAGDRQRYPDVVVVLGTARI